MINLRLCNTRLRDFDDYWNLKFYICQSILVSISTFAIEKNYEAATEVVSLCLNTTISMFLEIFFMNFIFLFPVCPAGEFAHSGGNDTKCEKCPQATYKADPGNEICTPCPGGRQYTAQTGSTNSSHCSEYFS